MALNIAQFLSIPFVLLTRREKKLMISGGDFGHDLTGVQNLQKKHGHLETELVGHDSRVKSLLSRGEKLTAEEHYASDGIKERCEELKGLWDDLKKAADERYVNVMNQKLAYLYGFMS